MQSGAQANGLVKRAHRRSRGHRVTRRWPEQVASVCLQFRQPSPQAPPSRPGSIAGFTVPRSEILIDYSAIRK
jgi:hypothetical protein